MSVYRPPSSSNIDTFFAELTISLRKAVNKFDNLINLGDFNIDITKEDSSGFDKLKELNTKYNTGQAQLTRKNFARALAKKVTEQTNLNSSF